MVTQEAIEYEIRAMDDPVVTVAEVIEAIDDDVSDTHVRQKMDLLAAAGTLEKKKVGARAIAWWHTDRVDGPLADPADHPDQTGLDEQPVSETPQDGAQERETEEEDDGTQWTVEEAVAAVDLPGQGEKEEDRKEALTFILRHLRDGGPEKADSLTNLSYNQFETHYDGPRSWWKNCATPALSELRDLGAVDLEDKSRGIWMWTGGN